MKTTISLGVIITEENWLQMSSRGRGRGRGYFGRGNSMGAGGASYRHREDHHTSHRGEHHSTYRGRGGGAPYRGAGGGSAEYIRHKDMAPPHREHHR